MKFNVTALKRCGKKVVYEVGKHSPALLVVAGGAFAVVSIVSFVKSTREMEEELVDMETRKEDWDKYDERVAEAEEAEQNADIVEAATGEVIEVEWPISPNSERVTTKEVIRTYAKHYALPTFWFFCSILCVGGAYIILEKRIVALGAALGAAIAETDAILQSAEEEYGSEAVARITSPTKVVSKAQGQRKAVYAYDDERVEALDNLCIMFATCEDFLDGDELYNIRMLNEINEAIYDYFDRYGNDILTMNQLKKDFLKYRGSYSIAGNVNGWTRYGREIVDDNGNVRIIGKWTGLKFDEKGIMVMKPDGHSYTDIEVRLPRYMQVTYC